MDSYSNLITAGIKSDLLTNDLSVFPEPLQSFLEEQKEQPTELKMIGQDILELANQVGEVMEVQEISEDNLDGHLSFLNAAESSQGTEGIDPTGSLFVSGSKIEVENVDFGFLDDQNLSDSENEDDSESGSDDEGEDEEESSNELDTDETASGRNDKKNDEGEDDGVFGQVSFYDEEPGSDVLSHKKKLNQGTVGTVKRKKGKKEKKVSTKRKKHKKKYVASTDDNDSMGAAGVMRRKNIRSILKEKDMDKDMLSAQNEEFERQKRLMDLKKSLLQAAAASSSLPVQSASSAIVTPRTTSVSTVTSKTAEKDSQLKSLLQVAEEEAQKEAVRKLLDKEVVHTRVKPKSETSPPSDVITLSSDSSESDGFYDDEDSEDVVMVASDEEDDDDDDEEDDAEDVNNGGSHINDTLNMPDADGKVKVNIGHPLQDPDIYLAPQIAQSIKPHQIGGVRFLYDNLVESLDRLKTTPGFGCILAHSMGLGKTIQLISFIDIFLRCAGGKRVLCIVPINTLQNWLAEFNYWLPAPEKLHPEDHLTQSRSFPLYIINDSMKTMAARAAVIEKWKDNGGVLVMGYEMFRLLSSKTLTLNKSKSRSRKAKPEVIDVEEEDKNKKLLIDMYSTLVNPGPDLVMCDEGHRIKNSGAAISQALKNIKTRRRVVLTGYPLQNNLLEYWCMVDFVRPNFLGNKGEFSNMFERPIMNGQCMDSTPSDKKVMRHRSYVLHNLLEGFVQRRGHTVLQLSLPPKLEHVLLVRLSPIQRKIYCEFMKSMTESGLYSWANNNPLKAFAVCCKVWNHPDILHEVVTKRITDKDNDLDIETGEGPAGKKKTTPSKTSASSAVSTEAVASISPSASTASLTSLASEAGLDKNPITYDWAEPLMKHYNPGMLEYSGKFILMMALIEECLAVGDKILIFSQSLLTLNKIEEFLSKFKVPRPDIDENWHRNKTYFRLDGSTSAQEREKLINLFNDPDSKVWAFLLSTKAGCLGINLVAANRVIVVDASWNPCHDCQAICRVYRFGQIKRSYIYRLITDNTLEKKIYDRQINKQGMSDRIVDDMNPENKLTRRQVESLLDFEDIDFPVLDFSCVANRYNQDPVMLKVLQKHGYWLSKYPFTHESLLIDRKELRLSKREKRIAKEGYARAKQMNIAYSRPMYAAYRPPFMGSPYGIPPNSRNSYAAFQHPAARPVASVRPMITSHSQSGADDIKELNGQPLRPGVTIHQVITTTEIVLPGTNTGTQAGASAMNKIAAGQKILVIKTPKGVYIRTDEGKMFAVRSKAGTNFGHFEGINAAATTTSTTSTMSSSGGGKGMNNIDSSIMSAMKGALSSSFMGKKSSSLADLIAADDSFGADPAFGKKNIVLPPLGVRSARPLSHIPSSTRARPTIQATPVIITPNKPVVSMGTRKPARNVRSRQWKEAGLEGMRDLTDTDFSAQKEESTLTGMKSSTITSLGATRNPLAVPNFARHPLLSQGRELTPNNKQQTAANIPRAAYQARGQYQNKNQSLPTFPDLEDNLSRESPFKSQSSPLSLEHSLGSISGRTTSSTAGQRITKRNESIIRSNPKEDATTMDSDFSEDGQESQSDTRMRELWNLKPTGPKLGSFHDFGEDSNNSSRMGSFSDDKALPPYMMGFQQSERVSPSQSFQQGLPFSDPALPPSHGKRYGPTDSSPHTVSSNMGTSLRAQDVNSSLPFGGREHERFDASDLDMYVPTSASALPVDTTLQGHFHHLPHSSSSSSILASALQRSGLQDLDTSGSPSSGSQDTHGLDDSNRRGNLGINNISSFSRGMPSHYRDSFSNSPADSNNSSSSDSTGFMAISASRSTSAWPGSVQGSNLSAKGNPAGAAPRFFSANLPGKLPEVNNYHAEDAEQLLGSLNYLPANNNPGGLAGRVTDHDGSLGGDIGQNLQQFSVSPYQSSQSSMMGLHEPPPSYLSTTSQLMKATRSSNSGTEHMIPGAYNYPYAHSNQLGFGPGDQGNLDFTS